ncbi:MAG: hypothetical protein K0Q57_1039, partial [Gammaproteobacteria bacterium]|nr:hypothetical protein [Gammaproteobacteria bacterium]
MLLNLLPWRSWRRQRLYQDMLVYASLPLLFTMLIIGCLYGYEARLLQQNIHLESRLTDQAKLLQQAQDQYIESYH